MACGGTIFINNFQILEKKLFFSFITIIFLFLLHHKTLKGSRNIQGFDLIRAVLLNLAYPQQQSCASRNTEPADLVLRDGKQNW